MNNTYYSTPDELMLAAMPSLRELLRKIRRYDRNLEDQARRAATSAISNCRRGAGPLRGPHGAGEVELV